MNLVLNIVVLISLLQNVFCYAPQQYYSDGTLGENRIVLESGYKPLYKELNLQESNLIKLSSYSEPNKIEYGGLKSDDYDSKYEIHAPIPYKFGYDIKDGHGKSQVQKEEGDEHGNKKGSYGYVDGYGIYRQVDYVADKHGFRATIKTNEPGTSNKDPADVHIYSEAIQYKPSYPELDQYKSASVIVPSTGVSRNSEMISDYLASNKQYTIGDSMLQSDIGQALKISNSSPLITIA